MFHRARRLVSERVSRLCVMLLGQVEFRSHLRGGLWGSVLVAGEALPAGEGRGFPKKGEFWKVDFTFYCVKSLGLSVLIWLVLCYRSCGGAAVGQHMLSSSCMNSRLFPMAFALAVWVAEQRNMVFSLLMSRSASCPTLPSTYPLVSVCMCGAQKHSLSHIMTYYYYSHQWRFSDV